MGTNVYRLIDENPILEDYIKSDEEINKEIVAKIREKYSQEDEDKLKRLAINAMSIAKDLPVEYDEYNNYVEECRNWGDEQKLEAQEKLELTEEIEIEENDDTRVIRVYID